MKPRRVPCSFSKRSWYFLRISITGAMLTSLKVVRIAAVDCDCTRRSATRWRSRDIGTRCSGRRDAGLYSALAGGAGCRASVRATVAGAVGAVGAGAVGALGVAGLAVAPGAAFVA